MFGYPNFVGVFTMILENMEFKFILGVLRANPPEPPELKKSFWEYTIV